jgi:uncharacterized RDD family membrane protein YckC
VQSVTDQRSATSTGPGQVAPEPVTVARRFVALFIDWILCLLVSTIFGDPRRDTWIPLIVLVVEYAFFIGLFTQTPGMFVRSIRCVSVTNGGPIGVPLAALRGILLCLVIPAVIMDGERRGLHDRWTGSVVVDASRQPRRAG